MSEVLQILEAVKEYIKLGYRLECKRRDRSGKLIIRVRHDHPPSGRLPRTKVIGRLEPKEYSQLRELLEPLRRETTEDIKEVAGDLRKVAEGVSTRVTPGVTPTSTPTATLFTSETTPKPRTPSPYAIESEQLELLSSIKKGVENINQTLSSLSLKINSAKLRSYQSQEILKGIAGGLKDISNEFCNRCKRCTYVQKVGELDRKLRCLKRVEAFKEELKEIGLENELERLLTLGWAKRCFFPLVRNYGMDVISKIPEVVLWAEKRGMALEEVLDLYVYPIKEEKEKLEKEKEALSFKVGVADIWLGFCKSPDVLQNGCLHKLYALFTAVFSSQTNELQVLGPYCEGSEKYFVMKVPYQLGIEILVQEALLKKDYIWAPLSVRNDAVKRMAAGLFLPAVPDVLAKKEDLVLLEKELECERARHNELRQAIEQGHYIPRSEHERIVTELKEKYEGIIREKDKVIEEKDKVIEEKDRMNKVKDEIIVEFESKLAAMQEAEYIKLERTLVEMILGPLMYRKPIKYSE